MSELMWQTNVAGLTTQAGVSEWVMRGAALHVFLVVFVQTVGCVAIVH